MCNARETRMGPQALLVWTYLFGAPDGIHTLEDPAGDYRGQLESMEAEELLSVIRQAQAILKERGWTTEVSDPSETDGKLVITQDFRIHLNSPKGPEVRMRPMTKAIFLLFLKHPEGIELKRMDAHAEELTALYRRTTTQSDPEAIERAVRRVLDAESRETNVAAARIAAALSEYVDNARLPDYIVSGRYGSEKSIKLDRRLVEWL